MMTCKQIAELLLDYCEGELCAESCELICQHIKICRHCNNYVSTYQITMKICRGLPKADMPQHLLDRLREELSKLEE